MDKTNQPTIDNGEKVTIYPHPFNKVSVYMLVELNKYPHVIFNINFLIGSHIAHAEHHTQGQIQDLHLRGRGDKSSTKGARIEELQVPRLRRVGMERGFPPPYLRGSGEGQCLLPRKFF